MWGSSSSPNLRQGFKPASCSCISTCLFWAQLLIFDSFQTWFLCLLVQKTSTICLLKKYRKHLDSVKRSNPSWLYLSFCAHWEIQLHRVNSPSHYWCKALVSSNKTGYVSKTKKYWRPVYAWCKIGEKGWSWCKLKITSFTSSALLNWQTLFHLCRSTWHHPHPDFISPFQSSGSSGWTQFSSLYGRTLTCLCTWW